MVLFVGNDDHEDWLLRNQQWRGSVICSELVVVNRWTLSDVGHAELCTGQSMMIPFPRYETTWMVYHVPSHCVVPPRMVFSRYWFVWFGLLGTIRNHPSSTVVRSFDRITVEEEPILLVQEFVHEQYWPPITTKHLWSISKTMNDRIVIVEHQIHWLTIKQPAMNHQLPSLIVSHFRLLL